MKICPKCGAKSFDIYKNCEICNQPMPTLIEENYGDMLTPQIPVRYYLKKSYNGIPQPLVRRDSGCSIVAKIFLIISCIFNAIIFVLSFLLWAFLGIMNIEILGSLFFLLYICMACALVKGVPTLCMTITYFRRIFSMEYIGACFKICTLIFINPIAGILMLCDAYHP